MSGKYYDGTKLLSLKDIDGNDPEIYICTSNRTAGKTTWFNRYCVKRYLERGEKFGLLYRYQYELGDCADKFFKDINGLFYPDHVMKSETMARGIFAKLLLDDECCGYALAINSADNIKRYSHLFSDIKRLVFDEFQSETNHYCPNEINKFMSVHTSIARGQGEMVRRVPVYMISNPVSIINPYYAQMGISPRLKSDTKFLRGEGYVLEQGYNAAASAAQRSSGFAKAFGENEYTAYSAEGVYLNDNKAFIEKPAGSSRYICTIKYEGKCYAVREFLDAGIIYVDDRVDNTFRVKITTTTDDHQVNYVMLRRHSLFISSLRDYFEKGCFRFKNLQCKAATMATLSY